MFAAAPLTHAAPVPRTSFSTRLAERGPFLSGAWVSGTLGVWNSTPWHWGKNSTSATLNSYRIAKAPTSTSIF
jgi:hypothetical protein